MSGRVLHASVGRKPQARKSPSMSVRVGWPLESAVWPEHFTPHHLLFAGHVGSLRHIHVLPLETRHNLFVFPRDFVRASCFKASGPEVLQHVFREFSMQPGGMVLSPPGAMSRSLHMNL